MTSPDYTPRLRRFSAFNLGSGVRSIGHTFGDDANSFLVLSYTLIDMTARYNLPILGSEKYRWQLAVNASNLADRRYVSICLDASAGCFYGARRDVLGSVGIKW
jgi:iron complex outermembrane receptor protein